MKFVSPLYFLLIIPAAVLVYLYTRGIVGKEPALKFSNVQIVKRAGAKSRPWPRIFQGLLRFSIFLLLILAMTEPQTSTGEEKTNQEVVDIMIALDVSGSMATLDFHPDNRLEAAKLEAKNFIKGRRYDRMGLVIFSGQSVTQCPLTVDRQALLALLESTQMGTMEDGTAIGLGLGNAVNRLKDSEAKSKIIILLTDGVNNSGEIDPLTAAGLAKEFGIKVYTIGVGKEGEALLPIEDPRFGRRVIKVQTEIDEKILQRIANTTGGAYFRAQDEGALRRIFEQIDRLEKTKITVQQYVHYEPRYFWFLVPALFLLLFEILYLNFLRLKIP